jgi:mRNA-degrading endonuclease RelE of RelBE toxin-antitoxin system
MFSPIHPSSFILHPFFMWNDRLRIAESVLPQWRALNDTERDVVRRALESIDEDPIIGAPLFEPLRGYWTCSVDGLRIVYRIVAEARFVVILSITRR